jgi:hypothetical protein
MKTELELTTRIALLQSRDRENKNIIKKCERQLRKVQAAKSENEKENTTK